MITSFIFIRFSFQFILIVYNQSNFFITQKYSIQNHNNDKVEWYPD